MHLWLKNETQSQSCLTTTGYADAGPIDPGQGTPPLVANTAWTIPQGDAIEVDLRVRQGGESHVERVGDERHPRPDEAVSARSASSSRRARSTGSDRTVTVTWSGSNDTNFYGYRVFRSIESGPFQINGQTVSTSHTDTAAKNYSSVRYLVRAYDKAGNESLDSATVSYAKNRC